MIGNPSASTDALDVMGQERENLRKDVVYSTHKVLGLGVGRSHLFRPYRGPRGPKVTFKTKLVHRWPNLPGPVQKGVKFSSIPRGCGGEPRKKEDAKDNVEHWWNKVITDQSNAAATNASDEQTNTDAAYWMKSVKGSSWSKSTDERGSYSA